jgi:hypothetical protein
MAQMTSTCCACNFSAPAICIRLQSNPTQQYKSQLEACNKYRSNCTNTRA